MQHARLQCVKSTNNGYSRPAQKSESLCFLEAYNAWIDQPLLSNPDPDYAECEMKASSAWMVKVCFGASQAAFKFSNPIEWFSIGELKKERDSICMMAEDLLTRIVS